jgi:hypothetical protein
MPFNTPFRAVFHPGDLVYGLAGPRDDYFYAYSSFTHAMYYLEEYGVPIVIDTFTLPYELKARYRDTLTDRQKLCANNKLIGEFMHFLGAHSSEKYRHLLTSSPHDPQPSNGLSGSTPSWWAAEAREDKMTSRKCKAGLAWMAAKGGHVHFVLDGINISKVIHKAYSHGNSFTATELRWVYRNRFRQEVQRCVQFWNNGQPVVPPWETVEGKTAWQNYSPNFVPEKPGLVALRVGF